MAPAPRLLLALSLLSCADKGETGTPVDSGPIDPTETAIPPIDTAHVQGAPPTLESCIWDGFGLCFELANYPETAAWCTDLGDLYNLPTTHVEGPCARDAVVITCDLPALGLFPVPTTVYYYASGFTLESATEACTSSGGVVGPAP
jgi:hypothetical protein